MTQQTLRDIEELIEAEQAMVDAYDNLMENEGWKILCTLMMAQTRVRRNMVLTQDGHGLDGMIERQKEISELAGINTAMQMPAAMIEESKMTLEGLRERYEDISDELEEDNTPIETNEESP